MTKFASTFSYYDRQSKAQYVWEKYQSILEDSILDVGADETYLKTFLPNNVKYWGIDIGGTPDQIVNLETDGLKSFASNSFNTIICLDVLEHIDNPHEIFDEMCRVTKNHLLLTLPNPVGSFISYQFSRSKESHAGMKFYGLPTTPPPDRHKWFFSRNDVHRFFKERAEINQMEMIQLDDFMPSVQMGILQKLRRALYSRTVKIATQFTNEDLFTIASWCLLKKTSSEDVL